MTCTVTTITERSAVSCPTYSTDAVTCPSYTERGTVTCAFEGTETGTGTGTDTVGPVISNIRALTITDTWASFAWETDEPGTCYVGVTTDQIGIVITQVSSHDHYVIGERDVVVTNMKSFTTYYIVVRTTDIYGNASTNRDYKFKTPQADGSGGLPVQDV